MTTAWQAASEDIYKASQEAGANAEGSADAGADTSGEGKEEVTDVEYEEVKDDN